MAINRDDLQKLSVIFDDTAHFFQGCPKFPQASGKFGQRDARGKNLRFALLEKSLNASPAKLLPKMRNQRGGVKQEAQRSPLGRPLCNQLCHGISLWRELAASSQQAAGQLSTIRNHSNQNLFSPLKRLPIKLPPGLDPKLPSNFSRDGDHILLGDGGNHGFMMLHG